MQLRRQSPTSLVHVEKSQVMWGFYQEEWSKGTSGRDDSTENALRQKSMAEVERNMAEL